MDNVILRTERLCKSFSTGGFQQHVLKNMDLKINEGDFTIIMGSSGSGKSTLLYALSGMDRPSTGLVFFGDTEISKFSNDKLALFRRKKCGFVFQNIYLLDNMSVLDNVLTSGLLVKKNSKELAERAKGLLEQVGINDALWNKFPNQLSGGECQRVGIVRALINEPEVIFADEPTGALNSAASTEVLNVLTKLNESRQSIVLVTHDIKTAARGNRIIYVKDGCISGELRLEKFALEEQRGRKDHIQAFLNEMGW